MINRPILIIAALAGVGLLLPIACGNSDDPQDGGNVGGAGNNGGSSQATGGATYGEGGNGVVIDCSLQGDSCTNADECCSDFCDTTSGSCSCGPVDKLCEAGSDCCSGQCNPYTSKCVENLSVCAASGTPCASPTECCSLSCGADGMCSADACVQDTQACSTAEECCSGKCENNVCEPLTSQGGGNTVGNSCTDGSDCLSGLCTDSTCSASGSYCMQKFDVCTLDSQCCTGVCTVADGEKVGFCNTQDTSGTRCGSKKIAGEVCSGDCSECCSRTCAPYGPSGVTICQPTTGCRTDGELCRSDDDCCGGNADSSVPGAGTAQCLRVNPDDEVGRCKVGACNPDGAICGSPDDGTAACDGSLSAPNGQKCCGTKLPDYEGGNACVADNLLVPRCSTIPGECVEKDGDCATSDDCCGGACVKNDQGRFTCYEPPGGECVPSGGPCSATADCCVGTMCILQPGYSTGICSGEPPDTGTGGGGNVPECAAYGQDCSTASCCSGIPCDAVSKTCRYPIIR